MGKVSPSIKRRSVLLFSSSLRVLMSPMRFWEMMSFWAVDNHRTKQRQSAKPTWAKGDPICVQLALPHLDDVIGIAENAANNVAKSNATLGHFMRGLKL